LRVSAVPAAFSGLECPNGGMAGRLAAYSCRGSRSLELRSLLIPSRGTCRAAASIAGFGLPQVRMLARMIALLYRQRRNGCPEGLNREVRKIFGSKPALLPQL